MGTLDSSRSVASPTLSVDADIRPESYRLGAGDKLLAYIWGADEQVLSLSVTHSGFVIIPSVGAVEVSDRNLEAAKKMITSKIKEVYRADTIDIFLNEIKTVTVPVHGHVTSDTSYVISGATRLSHLLQMIDFRSRASRRKVIVRNDINETSEYDMLAVFRGLENGEDPYLLNGDRVFIPVQNEFVSISGAVNYPGRYGFVEGDVVRDIIDLSGDFSRGVDSTHVTVVRFLNNDDSLDHIRVDSQEFDTFELQKDDRIIVSQIHKYRRHRSVHISGEVLHPGTYPIRDDKTRLIDIIEEAGGLTDKAYVSGSRIDRKKFIDPSEAELQRLNQLPYSELFPLERNFLKYRKTASSTRLSIDFDEIFNGPDIEDDVYNVVLRDGDRIHIAERAMTVNVMGAVVRPGLVRYEEDKGLNYYIELAGGLSEDARRRNVKIIKGGTENWLNPRDVDEIEIGDAIWIPEREYVDRVEVTKDILSIVGGIASILTAWVTVMNYLDE
jgi:protein involved in polysaccharide export with SLBB domain